MIFTVPHIVGAVAAFATVAMYAKLFDTTWLQAIKLALMVAGFGILIALAGWGLTQ